MKKNTLNSLLIILTALPSFALAGGVGDLQGFVALIKSILSSIIPLIMGLATVYFIWSLVGYISKAGEAKEEAKAQMIWGIIILFVMVSVWGFVNILTKTIFG
ncbi:MAG: hypothetical protein KAJ58_01460 [Candidatus Pacebacteria bacterium]|nr:hypothetical protein [Candidatus Paceibacterota bacterium]